MMGDPLPRTFVGEGRPDLPVFTHPGVLRATLTDMLERFNAVMSDVYTGACLHWAREGHIPETLIMLNDDLHRAGVLVSTDPRQISVTTRRKLLTVGAQYLSRPLFEEDITSQVREARACALIYLTQQPVDEEPHLTAIMVSGAWPERVLLETRAGIVHSDRHSRTEVSEAQRLRVERWLTAMVPGPTPGDNPTDPGSP